MTATAAGTSVGPARPRLPWILLGVVVVLVALDALRVDLERVMRRTMQPSLVTLWLREPGIRR